MKFASVPAGIMLVLLPSPSSAKANPQEEAVKAVVAAIANGEDMIARFPGAISPKEIPTLQGLAKCTAHNLMRQKKGYYTIVWVCGAQMLGMEILLTDGRVTSISTMEVYRRPKYGG